MVAEVTVTTKVSEVQEIEEDEEMVVVVEGVEVELIFVEEEKDVEEE